MGKRMIAAAVSVGLLAGACENGGGPEPTGETTPTTFEDARTEMERRLTAREVVGVIVVDKVVFPRNGIVGEEAAYWPIVDERDNESLLVVQCDKGGMYFEEVDTSGAMQQIMTDEPNTGGLEPFVGDPYGPAAQVDVRADLESCTLQLEPGQNQDMVPSTVAYVGTPRG